MGGKPAQKFYVGPIVLQPPEALDTFVRMASAGNEFVYAEAPEEPRRAECWTKAGELAHTGLVRTHQRRRAGGGWEYYLVRTGKPLPREVSAQEKALADRATSIIFTELKRAANVGRPCPTDADLTRVAGLSSRNQASWRVRKLIDVGLIESEQVYENGVPARVVTILETRYAGSAGGKFTALPKKYAALRQAAERDIREGAVR